jgi:hypothetical protein
MPQNYFSLIYALIGVLPQFLTHRGVNYAKKRFMKLTHGKPFHRGLIFAGKVGAYLSGALWNWLQILD